MPDLYDIPAYAVEILRGSSPLTESQRRAADVMLSEYGMRIATDANDATRWVVVAVRDSDRPWLRSRAQNVMDLAVSRPARRLRRRPR